MWTQHSRARIICLASVVVMIAGAGAVRGQNESVENIKRNIASAEQTLRNEPYLAALCPQLADGNHFYHRSLRRVLSLAQWDRYLKGEVVGHRMKQDRADFLSQEARRRRNEAQNACNLNYWKAELARVQKPKTQGGSDPQADFNMNWTYGGGVVQVERGKGTLTGSFQEWTYKGTATNGATVNCSGKLDPGVIITRDGNARGTIKCEAKWGSPANVWACEGRAYAANGSSVYAGQWAWFGSPDVQPENTCVGTVVDAGKPAVPHQFGPVYIRSNLGWPLEE